MRQRKAYRKGIKQISAVLLLCVMLIGLSQTVSAEEFHTDRSGSILLTLAVTEEEQTTAIPGVLLTLYRVGAVHTDGTGNFALDERLAEANVDLDKLDRPEKVQEAARKLEAVVGDSGIEAVSVRTDQNGKAFWGIPNKGVYLIVQGDGEETCTMAPMLLTVPYSEDGEDWTFDIEASPKVEQEEQTGSLTVEKQLLFWEDGEWTEKKVKNATIYVGLFLDEEATIPYGEIKGINIQNDSRGTASWTGLAEGTYYLRETNPEGVPRPLNEPFEEASGHMAQCVIAVDGEPTTRVTYQTGEHKDALVEDRIQDEENPPVKTGDEGNPISWLAGALISGAVIVIVLYLLKVRKRK